MSLHKINFNERILNSIKQDVRLFNTIGNLTEAHFTLNKP